MSSTLSTSVLSDDQTSNFNFWMEALEVSDGTPDSISENAKSFPILGDIVLKFNPWKEGQRPSNVFAKSTRAALANLTPDSASERLSYLGGPTSPVESPAPVSAFPEVQDCTPARQVRVSTV